MTQVGRAVTSTTRRDSTCCCSSCYCCSTCMSCIAILPFISPFPTTLKSAYRLLILIHGPKKYITYGMTPAPIPMNPKILSAHAPVMVVKSCTMTSGMMAPTSMRKTAAAVSAASVPGGEYASKR